MSMNMFLGLGAEAFEDQPEVPVVETPPVVAAPVSEEVIALIAERDDSDAAVEVATAGAEIAASVRQIDQYADAIERIENVQASMEHFMENGITPKAAAMLHSQINGLYASMGKGAEGVGSGLESFDNEDTSMAILNAGMEALNSEKASLGERIRAAWIGSADSTNKFFTKWLTRAGALKRRAQNIVKAAQGKSGSAEVTLKSRYLTVKGGQASTNLLADITAFQKFAEDGAARYFKDGGAWLNGELITAVKKMAAVSTVEEAGKIVDSLKYPGYPGATIAVQDKPAFTIKRTEVVLGGYAVFDLQYKTTGGSTQPEIIHELKALGKNRVHVKQAPDEKGKSEFSMSVSAADAIAIANAVIKLADIGAHLEKNIKWMDPFTKSILNGANASRAAMTRNDNAEKGVAVILDYLARAPTGVFQSVQSLTWELSQAIFNVADAALKVANKVAKTSESGEAAGGSEPATA